jgi:hypothetical protein
LKGSVILSAVLDKAVKLPEVLLEDGESTKPGSFITEPKMSMPKKIMLGLIPPLCIFGGALTGPLADKFPAAIRDHKAGRSMQQIVWRYGALLTELIVVAPFYIYFKRPSFNVSPKALLLLIFASLMNVLISFGYTSVSFYTVMSHIYVLASLGGCFLLIGTILMCKKTHYLERVGLVMALAGALIMVLDPDTVKNGEKISIVADLMALLINIPWILLFSAASYVKDRMDMGLIVFCMSLVIFLTSVIGSLAFEGTSFDTTDNGIWGFYQPKNLQLCFIWGALFTCFWANQGYIIALLFYPQIFVMNFMLLEPVVS